MTLIVMFGILYIQAQITELNKVFTLRQKKDKSTFIADNA